MPDAVHQLALDAALAAGGVEATAVPVSGAGPFAVRALIKPIRDQVADFPELAGILGAAAVGWLFCIPTDDYPLRFVAGDRLTLDDDTVHEVRLCRAHPVAPAWLCETFVVDADEAPISDDAFMLPLYFAGIEELGL